MRGGIHESGRDIKCELDESGRDIKCELDEVSFYKRRPHIIPAPLHSRNFEFGGFLSQIWQLDRRFKVIYLTSFHVAEFINWDLHRYLKKHSEYGRRGI